MQALSGRLKKTISILKALKTEEPVRAPDLSDLTDISISYCEQLLTFLRKKGLVQSVRGPGGGYSLARPISEITFADITVCEDERDESVMKVLKTVTLDRVS